ncbi:Rho GTPase-activating protein REN1 [Bienertia sinuspersici]
MSTLKPSQPYVSHMLLQAETIEDLQEWKTALENALEQAPIATNNAGQNGVLKNEQSDAANGSAEQRMVLFAVIFNLPALLSQD